MIDCKPQISVIIPCYNQANFLPETLDSVLAQSYQNWECIIVNDGSSDNTEQIAQQYCKKDNRFKYILKANGGLSSARNVGVRSSQGVYILPLDSDDKIASWYIEKCIYILESNQNVKVCYSKQKLFGKKQAVMDFPPYTLDLLLCRNFIFCSGVYRRVDYDKTEGYRENMKFGFEDWDFWLQLLGQGGEVHKIDDIGFFYRIRSVSMATKLNSSEKGSLMRHQIWENHKDLYATHFVDPKECYEYKQIESSAEYRIGIKLLKIIRKII